MPGTEHREIIRECEPCPDCGAAIYWRGAAMVDHGLTQFRGLVYTCQCRWHAAPSETLYGLCPAAKSGTRFGKCHAGIYGPIHWAAPEPPPLRYSCDCTGQSAMCYAGVTAVAIYHDGTSWYADCLGYPDSTSASLPIVGGR